MKATEDLYLLIQSLNRMEKRYFKMFYSSQIRGEINNYMKVFDAIEKQKVYNESLLLKQFKNETFVKQFSVVKNYLHSLILKSLRVYYHDSSNNIKLRELLTDIEILFNRSLLDQCKKKIEKGKQLAAKLEKYTIMLELLNWEYKLMAERFYMGNTEEDIQMIFSLKSDILNKLTNLNYFDFLSADIFFAGNHYELRSKEGKQKIQKLQERLNECDNVEKQSLEAMLKYRMGAYHFYSMIKENERAYLWIKEIVDLLENNPFKIEEDSYFYIASLENLINAQLNLKKYKEQEVYIKKLENMMTYSPHHLNEIKLYLYNKSLQSDIVKGLFKEGSKRVLEIENYLTENSGIIDSQIKMVFYFNISHLYFGNKEYSKALFWLNKILNESEAFCRIDIYSFSMLFNLIIHYELNNEELLFYRIKSTYRFLLKKNRLFEFESAILSFIRKKALKIKNSKDLTQAFKALKEKLIEIKKDKLEREFLEEFDFVSWLESKIENRPFKEIVREKSGCQN